MYWHLLSDAALELASALRAHLPWVLLATGLLMQAAGVFLVAQRAGRWPRVDTVALAPGSPDPGQNASMPGHTRFAVPVVGGTVPRDPDLLPGARRAYRAGEHQGVDFRCRPGTKVRAAADGWVLSINDEPSLPEVRRNEVLDYSRSLGRTPPEVLEVLHGRRVVLCHGLHQGTLVTTSYSHLEHVQPGLKPGDRVEQGEAIGTAGASGTSHVYRTDGWAELHFEVRIDGRPLGAGLHPSEAGALYRSLLTGGQQE